MANSFSVIHPKPARVFVAPFFVAYGQWLGTPVPLTGILKDAGGNTVAVGTLVLSNPKIWAMVFQGIPDGDGYVLELNTDEDVKTVENLCVGNTNAIQIMYPSVDDLPVGTTFITYGSTNVTTELSAGLTPNGGGSVVYLWGPPESIPFWAFAFEEVEIGGYALHVEGGTSETGVPVVVI